MEELEKDLLSCLAAEDIIPVFTLAKVGDLQKGLVFCLADEDAIPVS